jgi:hypothetical protein
MGKSPFVFHAHVISSFVSFVAAMRKEVKVPVRMAPPGKQQA